MSRNKQTRKGIISLKNIIDPNHHEEVGLFLDVGMGRIMFGTTQVIHLHVL